MRMKSSDRVPKLRMYPKAATRQRARASAAKRATRSASLARASVATRATGAERGGEAPSERRCRGVRGAKPPRIKRRPRERVASRCAESGGALLHAAGPGEFPRLETFAAENGASLRWTERHRGLFPARRAVGRRLHSLAPASAAAGG